VVIIGLSKNLDNLKKIACDIHCGHHSNIPKCCIVFYVTIWQPIIQSEVRQHGEVLHLRESSFITKYHEILDRRFHERFDLQYIACPVCIVRNRTPNKIKKCSHLGMKQMTGLPWFDIVCHILD